MTETAGGRPHLPASRQNLRREENQEEERKQRKKESREEKQREAVLDAISEFPDGETSRTIRDTAGFGSTVTNRWLATLVEEGLVEECLIRKNKRNETGFRLKSPSTTA